MAETYLSIQEAAEISGKSIQTIRRALKTHRLAHKRKRTPQGFNYLISRDSLTQIYKLQSSLFEREKGGLDLKKKNESETTPVSWEDFKKFQHEVENMLNDNKKEKENFMRFMKAFQDRFVVLENQLKLIEQPNRKRWYKFWQ